MASPRIVDLVMIVSTDHPHFGQVERVVSPVRVGSERPSYRRSPRLHEHADQLLTTLLQPDPAGVQQLERSGAFAPPPPPPAAAGDV